MDVLATCRNISAQVLVDCIYQAVLDFRAGENHDDVTLVALTYHP